MRRRGIACQRWVSWVAGGLATLVAAGYGYYRWANSVPEFRPPQVRMPRPNSYDEFVRLTARLDTQQASAGLRSAFDPKAEVPVLRPAVARNRVVFDGLRRAFAHEYREPPQYSFSALYPHYGRFREAARGFSSMSKIAAAEGRWGDAAQAALDAMEVGGKSMRGGPLIGGLVGIAMQAIGLAALEPVLPHLDAREAEAAMRRVRRLRVQAVPFAETLAAEQLFTRGAMTQIFRGMASQSPLAAARSWLALSSFDGGQHARVSAAGLVAAFYPKRVVMANMDRYYAALIAASRKPWGQGSLPKEPSDPISALLAPVFSQAREKWVQVEAQLGGVEIWLAARIHQLRNDRTANGLAALNAPLTALPVDPFSGRPFVYRAAGGSFVVYSVGRDGRDNGGLVVPLRKQLNGEPGDLVVGRFFAPRDGSGTAAR